MVLEQGSAEEDSFPSGDEPSSEAKAYFQGVSLPIAFTNQHVLNDVSASGTGDWVRFRYRLDQGPLRQYQVRYDRMPLQALTQYAAFGGQMKATATATSAIRTIGRLDLLIGRPLSQTEVEGTMQAISRRRTFYWAGFHTGLLFGGFLAYLDRKSFKFPLRSPKPAERYDLYPLRQLPIVTGRWARLLWHGHRWLAYSMVSWLVSIPYSLYSGRHAQTANLLRDPRTKDVVAEYSTALRNRQQEMGNELQSKMQERSLGILDLGDDYRPHANSHQSDAESPGYQGEQGKQFGGNPRDDSAPGLAQDPNSRSVSNSRIASRAQMRPGTRYSASNRLEFGDSERIIESDYDTNSDSLSSSSSSSFRSPPSSSSSSPSPTFVSKDEDIFPTSSGSNNDTSSTNSPGSRWDRIREAANANKSSASSPDPSSIFPSSANRDRDPTNRRGILAPNVRQLPPQSAGSVRRFGKRQENATTDASPTDESGTVDNENSFSFFSSSNTTTNNNNSEAPTQDDPDDTEQSDVTQQQQQQAQREFDETMERERRMGGGGWSYGDNGNYEDGGDGDKVGRKSAWESRRNRGS